MPKRMIECDKEYEEYKPGGLVFLLGKLERDGIYTVDILDCLININFIPEGELMFLGLTMEELIRYSLEGHYELKVEVNKLIFIRR